MPGFDVSPFTRETRSPNQREERLAAFDEAIRKFVSDAVTELQAGIRVLRVLFACDVLNKQASDDQRRRYRGSKNRQQSFLHVDLPLRAGCATL
jgi:hypothetical protein